MAKGKQAVILKGNSEARIAFSYNRKDLPVAGNF